MSTSAPFLPLLAAVAGLGLAVAAGCSLVNAPDDVSDPGVGAEGPGGSGPGGSGPGGNGTGGSVTGGSGTGGSGGPPDTLIDSGPEPLVNQADASFLFSATKPNSTFQCRLDGEPFAGCSSPHDVVVGDGDHVFEVFAIDGDGVEDPTPAVHAWAVDTQPPETFIDAGPPPQDTSPDAHFVFSADEPATFECSLDDGAWQSCASPLDIPGLVAGSHELQVQAVDTAGNLDPSPAIHGWSVCTPGGGNVVFTNTGTGNTGTIQSWVVPSGVCSVTIEAWGAQGSTAGTTQGARMRGDFVVVPGETLRVLVGQQGGYLSGGGGTFVTTSTNTPLLVAGGGGGCFSACPAAAETVGRIEETGGTAGSTPRAAGGNGGNVGNATSGSGGGFYSNGLNAGRGYAFLNGGNGGDAGTGDAPGGFGGGGSRGGSWGQGGGGGYSGGSCGDLADTWVGCGGGGSFNAGDNQSNTAGVNVGHGRVEITWGLQCSC